MHRQGQVHEKVKVIIPIARAEINGQIWSSDEKKLERIRYKKTIADAAIDGVIPEGKLRTPTQAYKDVMGWLKRLTEGMIDLYPRVPMIENLDDIDEEDEIPNRIAEYGDFSKLNARWNNSLSGNTHKRLKKNPEEFFHYHYLYREARATWEIIPYELIIEVYKDVNGWIIGDFG